MSDTVAEAALTALAAPTPSGVFIDSGVGRSMITMLSQNAVRRRKNMILPFVPSSLFAAVEQRLAEAFEGEVRSVRSILRMFETSFRRLFLKFERFSSLKKSCGRYPSRAPHGLSGRGQRAHNAAARAHLVAAMPLSRLGGAFIRQGTVHHSGRFRLAALGIRADPCARASRSDRKSVV